MSEISAVGHRVVQGAEVFSETTIATDEVIDKIDELAELAPVHNHAHALALRACKKYFQMTFLRLLYLIPLSIRQCLQKLICTVFLMEIMKNIM